MADPPGVSGDPDDATASEQSGDPGLWYVLRHICLPPKLPGSDDTTVEGQKAIIDVFQEALDKFTEFDDVEYAEMWTECSKMVGTLQDFRDKESFHLGDERIAVAMSPGRLNVGGQSQCCHNSVR